MTNIFSMDPGNHFRRLMESGLCAAAAGRPLLPGPATTLRRPRYGGRKVRDGKPLEPLPSGSGKGSGKLEPFVAFCAELAELIEQDPDIPLVELQAALPAADGVPLFDKWDRRTSAAPRIHI